MMVQQLNVLAALREDSSLVPITYAGWFTTAYSFSSRSSDISSVLTGLLHSYVHIHTQTHTPKKKKKLIPVHVGFYRKLIPVTFIIQTIWAMGSLTLFLLCSSSQGISCNLDSLQLQISFVVRKYYLCVLTVYRCLFFVVP